MPPLSTGKVAVARLAAAVLVATAAGVPIAGTPAHAAPPALFNPPPVTAVAGEDNGPVIPRVPAPKKVLTSASATNSRESATKSREYVHLKFVEGSAVRLRGGRLVAGSRADLTGVEKALVASHVGTINRLFHLDEAELDRHTKLATAQSGRQQADLNLWYRLKVKPHADPLEVANALNRLDVVETAYPEPLPAPAPLAPDFTAQQGYRSPASASGIDAVYAHTIPGGRGGNVRVLDIEYAWNTGHEDLSNLRAAGSMIPNGTPVDPFNDVNHGTAVAGQLSGDDNGGGVVGLVPDAQLHTTNANNAERGYDLATSISLAASRLSPGDVILLEQQAWGPTGCGQTSPDFVPVEWYPAYYDAIAAATGAGITVVEAAGNGNQNLDNTCLYGTSFPSGRPDSGAIIVGAGGAPGCSDAANVRARLSFSTYGQRLNLQGWGECVTTTGYGALHGTTPNTYYTSGFNGTSSASPIVAAAAASLSSVAEQRGLALTPRDVRTRLMSTGTAQADPAGGRIGSLPNLRAAIAGLPAGNTWTASASVSASGLSPGQAIDRDAASRWSTGVAQADGQYFQLDLGSAQTFNRLVLDAGAATPTHYPRGWQVRVSSDGTTWGDAIATGTGTSQLTTINLPTTTARYLRVTQTGSATVPWSIAELSVSNVANDFSVTVTPPSATVQRGASATATVETTTTAGSAQSVQLTATGVPTGVTVSFNPATVTSGGTSTMAVAVGSGAAPGTYPITVTGAAGGTNRTAVTGTGSVTRTATYTLTVATGDGLAFRGLAGRCIDVAGGSSADRTPVQLYDCTGGTAQQWSISGTTLRALGKCMDATAAGTANGTAIQLYTCNGTTAQNFTFNAATGTIVNTAANRCVDVTAANPNNETRLQLYDCNGTAAQMWARA